MSGGDAPQYWLDAAAPQPGHALALGGGVHWLRMPMPLALDHINLWLIDDGCGWTAVDCGLALDATRAAWEQLAATRLDGRPLQRVLCTHMHPDHVGLADWLCAKHGAELLMTQGEYLSARLASAGMAPTDPDSWLAHYRAHGATPDDLAQLAGRGNFYTRMVPAMPTRYRRIRDGETLRLGGADWQVIEGGGHSPEHAALWCAQHGLLISGDMLLPRISTNVSVFPIEPEADPLGRYLDALTRFEPLPADARVLPSHGLPFIGVHGRLRQLREHHADRLGALLQACAAQPRSARELVPVLFRRALDVHQLSFALGEAIAHAHRLWHCGALERIADDGVWRWRTLDASDAAARAAAGLEGRA